MAESFLLGCSVLHALCFDVCFIYGELAIARRLRGTNHRRRDVVTGAKSGKARRSSGVPAATRRRRARLLHHPNHSRIADIWQHVNLICNKEVEESRKITEVKEIPFEDAGNGMTGICGGFVL
ncbi:MAG: hypothetical protein LBM74_10510, partial [Oscillospiraceae bacterium]|nr:hypothetical protein [Oscillospiraceae bacterium]